MKHIKNGKHRRVTHDRVTGVAAEPGVYGIAVDEPLGT